MRLILGVTIGVYLIVIFALVIRARQRVKNEEDYIVAGRRLPLSLLFRDVDQSKAMNDSLGYEAGDRVLQAIASFLKRHVRRSDHLFRWGGDEFLILIWGTE